jgi:hypothetical protein
VAESGRRDGFKIHCPKGRAGSIPASGTQIVVRTFDPWRVHPHHVRIKAIKWHADGVPFGEICESLGTPRGTVGKWVHGERSRRMRPQQRCWRCADPPEAPPDAGAYAYLLGQYLGDGHVVHTARVPVLGISCTDAYPAIMDECEAAMLAVLAKSVHRTHSVG